MNLVERIVEMHACLRDAGVPHAFGGALALAWCTQRARGTIDIDVNLFVPAATYDSTLALLPTGVGITDANRRDLERDGQTRLWWDRTPVDVFFNTTGFHDEVATRIQFETFAGQRLPFLSCRDLAVFKAFFDRTKDWADLEEMIAAGSLDAPGVLGELALWLGSDDHRLARLRTLVVATRGGGHTAK